MTGFSLVQGDDGVCVKEADMFRTIAKGYGVTLAAGIVGYVVFGGSFWVWALIVWLAGAPVTLFFIGPDEQPSTKKPAPLRRPSMISWAMPSFGKTRLGGGS